MKKSIKKALSIVLIMCMLATLFCNMLGVSAYSDEYYYDEHYTIIAVKDQNNTFGSDHPYSNGSVTTWEYFHYSSTDQLLVTFSEDTFTEWECDRIRIYTNYDSADANWDYGYCDCYSYTGNELAGQTITIPGNRFLIELSTDYSVTKYGFQITDIRVPCEHVYDNNNDFVCNLCGGLRPHDCVYDNALDEVCNLCKTKRNITGTTFEYKDVYYTVNSAGTLDVTGCVPDSVDSEDPYYRYVDELVIQSSVYGRAVTGISSYAFAYESPWGDYYDNWYSKYFINKLVIPEGVKEIASNAFKNATITDLYIPSTIVNMYDAAFKYAVITNLRISDLAAWCGIYFGYETSNPLHCTSNFYVDGELVNDLVIPDGVAFINDYAFSDYSGITSVTIPSSVKSINESAFVSCYGISSVNLSEGLEEIKQGAFANCNGITKLTIPASVKTIGECAFCACYGLKDIIFLYDESKPNNGPYIEYEAFADSESITDIWCEATKSQSKIEIAYSEALLNAYWHYGTCDAASHIYDDACDVKCNSCGWIREDAHSYIDILDTTCDVCGDEREVSNEFYHGNYKYYAYKTYNNCDCYWSDEHTDKCQYEIELTLAGRRGTLSGEVIIPSAVKGYNVTRIGSDAFNNCYYITSVVIPDSVTTIDSWAFAYCHSLTSITIGKGVNYIGYDAFYGCYNLQKVYITNLKAWCEMAHGGDYATPLEYATELYLNGKLITNLVIPEGTEFIRYKAFVGLNHIESVTLPSTLETIHSDAFYGCSGIKTVRLKNGISNIGQSVFYNCTSIANVYYYGTKANLEDVNIGTRNGYLQNAKWSFVSCNSDEHIYDNGCDKTCNACGKTRSVSGHSWKKGVCTKCNTVSPTKVEITIQPTDAYANDGASVSTSVEAVGDGLTYTWYFRNSGSSSYTKSANKTATYTTTMSSTKTGCKVYCVVTDKYGNSATSNAVSLRWKATITKQPSDAYAKNGANVSTKVTAVGNGLKYTWYFKNSGATKFTKSSNNTATYNTTMSSTTNGRQVYCVVTDKYGYSVTSETATLSNNFKITKQPTTAYAIMGATASTKVTVVGEGLKYAWYFKNSGASSFTKSSNTTATYTATMSSTTKNRQVYCVVTDKNGKTIKSNTVTLRQSVGITKQPTNAYAKDGATASTKVTAAGDGLTYTWYFKNANATEFTKSSNKTATYSATISNATNNRQVYCVVTDKYGNTVTSNTVTLRRQATITKQPTTAYVKNGATASANVSAIGEGLTYTWYFKNSGATTFTKSEITIATYSTTMSDTTKNRQVYCVITDKYGKTVTTNTVTLREKVSITTQPTTVTVAKNTTAKTTVKARGDGLTYEWYFKNAGATTFLKSSNTTSSYSTTMTNTTKNRQVYCVVTDKYGKKAVSNTVTLKMK